MTEIFEQMTWRFIDQSISANKRSPLESFAIDDTLCHLVGQKLSVPTIRTWVHHDAVVLGIQDHRLPYIQEGMTYLASQGFEPIVRNSGGFTSKELLASIHAIAASGVNVVGFDLVEVAPIYDHSEKTVNAAAIMMSITMIILVGLLFVVENFVGKDLEE